MNMVQGNWYSPFGKILIILYCDFAQRDLDLARVISVYTQGTSFININKDRKKLNTVIGNPIINISIQETTKSFERFSTNKTLINIT